MLVYFLSVKSVTSSKILTIHQILGVCAKNLKATLLFVDFSKAFDSIHKGKMKQILLAYGLTKVTVTAIMMLYKNIKAKVSSPNRDTDFFDIVGVLQAPNLFIICLDYMLWMSINLIKKSFFTKKGKKQTILCRNYYWRRLCRWHNASGKYIYPSQLPAA